MLSVAIALNDNAETQFKKLMTSPAPAPISDSETNCGKIRSILEQLQLSNQPSKAKIKKLCKDFSYEFISLIKNYDIQSRNITGEEILETIDKLLSPRDTYIDFLEELISNEYTTEDFIIGIIENLYNEVMITTNSYGKYDFEHFEFFAWELLICSITILFEYDKFSDIYNILNHKFAIKDAHFSSAKKYFVCFTFFRKYLFALNQVNREEAFFGRKYALQSHLLLKREKSRIISSKNLAYTDMMLCQLSFIYFKNNKDNVISRDYWYPSTSSGAVDLESQWSKLRSKRYCEEIKPLFGVENIINLKNVIAQHPVSQDFTYTGLYGITVQVPSITYSIRLDDIAKEP